jgi:hypothetical protein
VAIIYQNLYLITWHNSITGKVEQILTDSADDARRIANDSKRLIDKIMYCIARRKLKYSITMITEKEAYAICGDEVALLEDCNSGKEGTRYLLKMFGAGKSKEIRTGLLKKEEIAGVVKQILRDKMCKGFVVNEIDYWGVYTLDENGERVAKISLGSKNSAYEKPEFTEAPKY